MPNNTKDLDEEMEALFDDISYIPTDAIDEELQTIANDCKVSLDTVIAQYNRTLEIHAEVDDESAAEKRQLGWR